MSGLFLSYFIVKVKKQKKNTAGCLQQNNCLMNALKSISSLTINEQLTEVQIIINVPFINDGMMKCCRSGDETSGVRISERPMSLCCQRIQQ